MRTGADVFGGLPLVIRVIVPIGFQQRLHAHAEVAGRLPGVRSGLHEPGRSGVTEGTCLDHEQTVKVSIKGRLVTL